MRSAINRRIRILQLLPHKNDGKKDVNTIVGVLENEGYGGNGFVRTVQRDLVELRIDFTIDCDDRTKPHLWYWDSRESLAIPEMGKFTALTLQLAEKMVKPLLPEQSLASLETNFFTAKHVLEHTNKRRTRSWLNKIRVIPHSLEQIKAPIRDGIYDTVSNALYEDKQLKITYMAASSTKDTPNTYDFHPYALLHDGTKTVLVGRIAYDKKIRPLHLHRIHKAEVLTARAVIPLDFDLDDYVKTKTAFPLNGKKIKLKAWIHRLDKNHVIETPLSNDQQIEYVENGAIIVKATVYQTIALKRWILGFGEFIEVLGPADFKRKIQNSIIEASKLYAKD